MQRYFITAESTYEDLRQSLNAQLAYPNALGKTVFQTALQAPRDSFRRVLLAVDTDLPNYAAIASAITPLTESDAMEEVDEATYLAAVASAAAGGGGGGGPPEAHSHGNINNDGTMTGGFADAVLTVNGDGLIVATDSVLVQYFGVLTEFNLEGTLYVLGPNGNIDFTNGSVTGLSYNNLDDLPTLGTAAAASTSDFAAASHNHSASAISSGTLDEARLDHVPFHPFLLMGG